MANGMQSAMQWLADKKRDWAPTTITYTRLAHSVTLQVEVGKTDAQLADSNGRTRTEWVDRDYLIHAAELILNGSVVTPAKGDQITQGTEVREVVPMDAEPHTRPSDTFSIRHRVHTKRIR